MQRVIEAWASMLRCRLMLSACCPLAKDGEPQQPKSSLSRPPTTSFLQNRNYKEAGDIYVRVSIGNQPWPIGVTMVGIHERRRVAKARGRDALT